MGVELATSTVPCGVATVIVVLYGFDESISIISPYIDIFLLHSCCACVANNVSLWAKRSAPQLKAMQAIKNCCNGIWCVSLVYANMNTKKNPRHVIMGGICNAWRATPAVKKRVKINSACMPSCL